MTRTFTTISKSQLDRLCKFNREERRKLLNEELYEELAAVGYTKHSKKLSPKVLEIINENYGIPE